VATLQSVDGQLMRVLADHAGDDSIGYARHIARRHCRERPDKPLLAILRL